MKKILAIAPYPYLPYFSGGQKFIAQFFHWLGQESDLTVITVPGNAELAETYKTIPLLKSSFSRYYDRSLVKKITRLVEQEKYDAIIWEHPYYGWLAKKIKKATGIRTIIHTHNIEYQRFRSLGKWWWRLLRSYERKCLKQADAILFITREDRDFAVNSWGIPVERAVLIPFGTDIMKHPEDKQESRNFICQEQGIDPGDKIFLFNGLLSYYPNEKALVNIIAFTNTVFRGDENFKYKIIISGKGLPENIRKLLSDWWGRNIIYTGFVEDIVPYFKGADVFLNPVTIGGGIKTKMVEAIAYGTTVVSTRSGAAGMDNNIAGDKLVVIDDNDWQKYAKAAMEQADIVSVTPPEFYENFYWGSIITRLLRSSIWLSPGH